MGVFSWLCSECEHPLLDPGVTNVINHWMSTAVLVCRDGELHIGEYDSYGHVGAADAQECGPFTAYHKACWVKAGSPLDFREQSRMAPDQGYFFDDPAHDMREPK